MYSILVADDKQVIREGIAELLRETFPELALLGLCSCGRDVLKIVKDCIPDIIIMDIRLPDISGLELCRRIRTGSAKAKIILISAYKEFEYAKTAIDLGVVAYLVKPYSPVQFIATVRQAISQLDSEGLRDEDFGPGTAALHLHGQGLAKSMVAYIEENYSHPDLSLVALSKHFNVNYTYASELFTAETGQAINDFINNVRLSKAIKLMQSTPDTPIETIATSVGYSGANYFSKLFKNRYGVTPSQYKRGLHTP